MKKILFTFMLSFLVLCASAQAIIKKDTSSTNLKESEKNKMIVKKWFDKIQLRGYVQVRYNRLLETNPDLKCEACDKSWGENGGFMIRRARIVFSGYVTPRIYFYIQPDFASSASSTNLHFGQLRDAYFDIGFDTKNELRLRLGQSKIPYGFENMQSSQNRLTLDRNDALNSGVPNERDLGAMLYWTPEVVKHRHEELLKTGRKSSGDYGVLGLALYNGQTTNKPEGNNQLHIAARCSYPFAVGDQVLEAGIQMYTGKYTIAKDQLSTGVKYAKDRTYLDERYAASVTLYPQPFGIQAEYNVGKGPQYDKLTDSISTQNLKGGYILASLLLKKNEQVIIPFAKWQTYQGGKKNELDERSYDVTETEIGIEWQPVKQLEFTASYVISSRRFEDHATPENLQKGNLLRLQAQINY